MSSGFGSGRGETGSGATKEEFLLDSGLSLGFNCISCYALTMCWRGEVYGRPRADGEGVFFARLQTDLQALFHHKAVPTRQRECCAAKVVSENPTDCSVKLNMVPKAGFLCPFTGTMIETPMITGHFSPDLCGIYSWINQVEIPLSSSKMLPGCWQVESLQ